MHNDQGNAKAAEFSQTAGRRKVGKLFHQTQDHKITKFQQVTLKPTILFKKKKKKIKLHLRKCKFQH